MEIRRADIVVTITTVVVVVLPLLVVVAREAGVPAVAVSGIGVVVAAALEVMVDVLVITLLEEDPQSSPEICRYSLSTRTSNFSRFAWQEQL